MRPTATVLADNEPGNQRQRQYAYDVAAPIVGYRSDIFGTAGLETDIRRAADRSGLDRAKGEDLLRKFRAQSYDPADLHTSLDIELQQAAADLLGDQHGAVVAIEPSTGRVLALVSSPTYDPNRIVDPNQGRNYVATLQTDTDSPLLNRATQGLYVPGSVFKIVTATAGLVVRGDHAPTPPTPISRARSRPASWSTASASTIFRARFRPTIRSTSTRRRRSPTTSGSPMPGWTQARRT